MSSRFNRRLYALFAASAMIMAAAVAGVLVVFHLESLSSHAERDAAHTVNAVLVPALADETSSSFAFTSLADDLISDRVRGIRLWTSDGQVVATSGTIEGSFADLAALDAATNGAIKAQRAHSSQGDVLISYAPIGNDVLEVQQDYTGVAAAVRDSRRTLLYYIAGGSVTLFLIVQAMLGLTTRNLKNQYERLLYLHQSGQAMRATLDLELVLEQLSRDAAFCTKGDVAIATLIEEQTDDLVVTASYDRKADSAAQHHRKVEEWYMRRCAATGEVVEAEQEAFPWGAILGYEPLEYGPVAILCVPVPGREKPIGVLMVVRSAKSSRYKPDEIHLVDEMASQAAMAVEQAALFAKVRKYADQVELSYDTTLKVLIAALDQKDSITQGHSERVSRLAVELAKEMGVPSEQLIDIERGALLHDVGKIGVPDHVLLKPDNLNPSEWEAMRKHPLLAGLMVSKVEFLEGALPILLYHHERYDGEGYPFGLEGKAIPLEARIFTVVDTYDAMTSDRPYREAQPHIVALGEIQRNAGTQFDPEVVAAFTRIMGRHQELRKAS